MKKSFFTKEHFHTDREDGRYDRTLGFLYEQFRQKKPRLSLDTVRSPEEYGPWQRKVRAKLRELLKMRENLQLDYRLIREDQRDGYRLYRYELYPEEHLAVPFLLLIPDDVIATGRKVPAVICNPGSGADLESLAGEPTSHPNRYPLRNRQAWWYAKAGMIGLAVENPGTADNAEPDLPYGEVQLRCYSMFPKLGRTYHGFITEQRLLLLEFLKQHPLVDPERLACSGMSLGCGGTLYVSLLSDDVKAVVYNDFVCRNTARMLSVTEMSIDPRGLSGAVIPNAVDWFDIQPDLHAALAPRHLLLAEGGAWKNNIEKIIRGYELAGMRDRLTVKYYEKYSDPASRKYDDEDLGELEGLTAMDFLDRSYVDAEQHSFHAELAIPWLTRIFFGKEVTDPELLAEFQRAHAEKEHVFNIDDEEVSPEKNDH